MNINIEADLPDLNKEFKEKIEDIPWSQVGEVVEASMKEAFLQGGKLDPPWPIPLDGGIPGIRTGALQESIDYSTIPDGIEAGSPLEYANYFDQGTQFMDPRPLFGITDSEQEQVEDIIAQTLIPEAE